MTTFDRRFVARSLALTAMVSAGVLATMRFADAIPGGRTRDSLSFSGTLQGRPSPQMLSFVFKKAGTTVCSPPAVSVTLGTGGQFTAEIPIDACPATLFDGGDVVFDISVGSTLVVHDRPVTPVPYARYADRVGTPDCPTGYEQNPALTGVVVCRRALAGGAYEEVVRVGSGASAFWIDRYEASVWQNADASDAQYGGASDDYPTSFPDSGQWTAPLFARSIASRPPSAYITWFQAQAVCRLSGKRLPTGEEWIEAARGTPDPATPSDGADGRCVTGYTSSRNTGARTGCQSVWGAQDMIGNIAEWTSEWFSGAGNGPTTPGNYVNSPRQPWPAGYNDDKTSNAFAFVGRIPGEDGGVVGMPAAAVRGGGFGGGVGAGIFNLDLSEGPTTWNSGIGFRCVIPR
jgi:formylglycine-generating enzyme required for sulfatase activity